MTRTDIDGGGNTGSSWTDDVVDEDRDTVYQRFYRKRRKQLEERYLPVDHMTEQREKPRRFQGD